MTVWDQRVPGREHLVQLPLGQDRLMLVPNEVRKCVVFIGERRSNGRIVPRGTGFFVGVPVDPEEKWGDAFVFLVSARHVIEAFDPVFIRVTRKNGDIVWMELPPKHPWVVSEDHPESDIVVTSIDVRDLDNMSVPIAGALDLFGDQRFVGTGDEVFVTGLFLGPFQKAEVNVPVVRVGNIAAIPEEPIEWMEEPDSRYLHLIEARSFGGLSGSPVFAHLPPVRLKRGKVVFTQTDPTVPWEDVPEDEEPMSGGIVYLIGSIFGHWDDPRSENPSNKPDYAPLEMREVNMGIAAVSPIRDLLEALNGKVMQTSMEDARKKIAKRKATSQKMDIAPDDEADEFAAFTDLTKGLLSVSKEELDTKRKEAGGA